MKTNREMRRAGILPVLAALTVAIGLLAAGSALAERDVHKSGKAASDGKVYVENLSGSIKIEGWNKDEIEVTGTLDDKVKELEFSTGKKSRIEVVYPRRVKNIDEGTHLVIMVPQGSSLKIECVSASIEIAGVEGEIEAETISGDVEITGPCRSTDVDVISGTVRVENPGKEVSVSCVSGDVHVEGDRANVEVEGVSGDIELAFEMFENLSVESVSGDIDVTGDLSGSGSFSMDVHSGMVTLTVPNDVSAEFDANSFNGEIKTDFGHEGKRTSKYMPGQELEFTTGGGDADVEINTFSGSIRIRKK